MKRRQFLVASALSCIAAPAVRAQPRRVVRIIVAFAPGGSGDLIPRIIAPAISEYLGQDIIVENRAGAGGLVGTSYVGRAEPDGLTLGVATVSTLAIQPAVRAQPPYDPIKDFAAISLIAQVPNVISINSNLPAQDMKQFIKFATSAQTPLTFASPGVGSLGHMMGELFAQATKANLRHIPYRGPGPALQDTIAGHVQMLCDNLPSSLPYDVDGRLRALGVAWPTRVKQLPRVPTFAEAGLPALNDPAWFGLMAPAGTPSKIVMNFQQAVAKALKDPQVAGRISELGAIPEASTSEEFAKQIHDEFEKWRGVAKAAHISLEA